MSNDSSFIIVRSGEGVTSFTKDKSLKFAREEW